MSAIEYVVDHLRRAIYAQIALDTNIPIDQVEDRLDDERLVMTGAARKYQPAIQALWATLGDGFEDTCEYWFVRNWRRRFAMTPIYKDDPITDEDIEDDEEYRLRPGEVIGFLLQQDCEFIEGPYPTDRENEVFFEAQRGGYDRDDFGLEEVYDDHDTRDLGEGWAEYLKPEGMQEVYGLYEWSSLIDTTSWAVKEADRLVAVYLRGDSTGLNPHDKWEWVRSRVRPQAREVWEAVVRLYLTGGINTVAMALVVHKLVSPTRFDREEMKAMTEQVPGLSHVDGTPLGISLLRWMQDYQEELDDILEDGAEPDWTPVTPPQEHTVAQEWVSVFEKQLEEHWTAQAKERKPVPVENGDKIWASVWMGKPDVAYNLAYLQAVGMGLTMPEVIKAAEDARNRARTPDRAGWRPNEVIVDATLAGLVTSRNVVIRWRKAPAMIGQMTVRDKEGLLAQMRRVYVQANGERPHIAAVGKAIAEL